MDGKCCKCGKLSSFQGLSRVWCAECVKEVYGPWGIDICIPYVGLRGDRESDDKENLLKFMNESWQRLRDKTIDKVGRPGTKFRITIERL